MEKESFIKYINKFKNGEIDKYNFYDVSYYRETIWELAQELELLPYYCFDGRYEDIFFKCLKSIDEETLNSSYDVIWSKIIILMESEFKKLVTPNILLLPLNFLRSSDIEDTLMLGKHAYIFLPTKDDLKDYDDCKLSSIQQRKRKGKYVLDSLSLYFQNIIFTNLDKEHILLAKDRNFFNYPILAIDINNIDYRVEEESGRIVESIYSILRMIDLKRNNDSGWGVLNSDLKQPAHTYVVYYNKSQVEKHPLEKEGYYGYSFRFNFEPMLDINTEYFLKNKNKFIKVLNKFVSSCFLDTRLLEKNKIDFINKWKSGILMFNTAYEFASIEKYDSAVLALFSILESLFIKNEGRDKQEKLILEIKQTFCDNKKFDLEKIEQLIRKIYKIRNKFIHEGKGYEMNFSSSRRLHDYQGTYKGMRPFSYAGSFKSISDLEDIKDLFTCVIDILLSDEFYNKLDFINDIL